MPSPSLADIVRSARQAAGLSGRDLARLCGLPQPTLVAIEGGRAPSLSNLQKILDGLPDLAPQDVLGPRGPLAASMESWRFFARVFGFTARRIALDVRLETRDLASARLHLEGLKPDRLHDEPSQLQALVGAASAAPAAALLEAAPASALLEATRGDPRLRRLRFATGDIRHDITVRGNGRSLVIDAKRWDASPVAATDLLVDQSPHGRPFVRGACAWVDIPVRALVLRLAVPPDLRDLLLDIHAWPATLGTAPGSAFNAWPDIFPHAARLLRPDARGSVSLHVDHPPLGIVFGLSWDREPSTASRSSVTVADGTRARAPGQAVPPGVALERARRRAGLSRRELARRVSASPATIVALEGGSDPRHDTLVRLLAALPDLRPGELLVSGSVAGRDAASAWREQQRLFGLEVACESRCVRVRPNGDATMESRTKGLVATTPRAPRVRMRHGLSRGQHTSADWVLESIDAQGSAGADASVRVVERGRGPVVYDLKFGTAAHALSYRRRLVIRGQVAMTPDAPNATRDRRGFRCEALFFEPELPTRLLVLEVRLPPGYWPDEIRAVVSPRACLPAWDGGSSLADPGALSSDRRLRRIELRVESPLVGLRYAIHWAFADS